MRYDLTNKNRQCYNSVMRKSVLTGTETTVRLSMPISKVDEEKRLVSGFATLDNVDRQGDRVLAKASIEAFQKFRGNIREMHQEGIAAGRLVSFEEMTYFDEETEKFLTGVYVTAYISKGAQSTWEKVLDGTLSGFSIGGAVEEFVNGIDPDTGQPVRTIIKYYLNELSLVDNPANQLANVLSFQKSVASGETEVTGIAAVVETKTIFFCPNDKKALLAKGEEHGCPECGDQMESIGWCESSGADVIDDMRAAVEKRLSENREGGAVNDMTTNKNEEVEAAKEETATAEEANAAEATETVEVEAEEQVDDETVEAAEPEVEGDPVDPAEDEGGEDLSEVIRNFQDKVLKAIDAGQAEQAEKVEGLRKELTGIETQLAEKMEALEKSISKIEAAQVELEKNFTGIQDSVSEVEKGLRAVDPSTAIKKSVDTDQSAEDTGSTGLWNGAFLNVNDYIA